MAWLCYCGSSYIAQRHSRDDGKGGLPEHNHTPHAHAHVRTQTQTRQTITPCTCPVSCPPQQSRSTQSIRYQTGSILISSLDRFFVDLLGLLWRLTAPPSAWRQRLPPSGRSVCAIAIGKRWRSAGTSRTSTATSCARARRTSTVTRFGTGPAIPLVSTGGNEGGDMRIKTNSQDRRLISPRRRSTSTAVEAPGTARRVLLCKCRNGTVRVLDKQTRERTSTYSPLDRDPTSIDTVDATVMV